MMGQPVVMPALRGPSVIRFFIVNSDGGLQYHYKNFDVADWMTANALLEQSSNLFVMSRLADQLSPLPLSPTQEAGIQEVCSDHVVWCIKTTAGGALFCIIALSSARTYLHTIMSEIYKAYVDFVGKNPALGLKDAEMALKQPIHADKFESAIVKICKEM